MITSTSNAQVKHIIGLLQKSKVRKEEKEFVVEGPRMVSETPADRCQIVYASESFVKCNPSFIKNLQCKYEVVADRVFEQMSDTKTPQGVLAVVSMLEYTLEDMLKRERPLFVCLENIQDPGNLGTIIRTSEGAGVSGVILSPGTVDVYNPKTIRSTMGSLYRVPFVQVSDWNKALNQLKNAGVKLFAAHLEGSSEYSENSYEKASAFLIGNEGNGLTSETANVADEKIRIPMDGQVESLNAAIATAILLFEAKRQRNR